MTQDPVGTVAIPCIVGRSSSHFTRIVRMVAQECGVECSFRVLRDILSQDVEAYGGNPGLKLPNLVTGEGTVFGSLNSARALAGSATKLTRIVWPEHTPLGVAANALEMTLQGMASEVSLIMVRSTNEGAAYAGKLQLALTGMLNWLENNLPAAQAALPARDL